MERAPTKPNDRANEDFTTEMTRMVVSAMKGSMWAKAARLLMVRPNLTKCQHSTNYSTAPISRLIARVTGDSGDGSVSCRSKGTGYLQNGSHDCYVFKRSDPDVAACVSSVIGPFWTYLSDLRRSGNPRLRTRLASPCGMCWREMSGGLRISVPKRAASGLIHPVGTLFSARRARPTFSMISSAVFRQTNGLGALLCCSM